jgi:hypothetical protein
LDSSPADINDREEEKVIEEAKPKAKGKKKAAAAGTHTMSLRDRMK